MLIANLNSKISEYTFKHKAIGYYIRSHHYVPLWVLATIMSFGSANRFFSRLKFQDKVAIAAEFNMKPSNFESILYILCAFRNKCAHGERIYSYKKDVVRSKYIPLLPYHAKLGLSRDTIYGREDVLALLIVLKYFIPAKHYTLLIARIENRLNKLSASLSTISITKVMNIMGLPPNWTQLKHL